MADNPIKRAVDRWEATAAAARQASAEIQQEREAARRQAGQLALPFAGPPEAPTTPPEGPE